MLVGGTVIPSPLIIGEGQGGEKSKSCIELRITPIPTFPRQGEKGPIDAPPSGGSRGASAFEALTQ